VSAERLKAMRRSLEGLALGDALGQALISAPTTEPSLREAPWRYSDDTEMAIAIACVLARHGRIDQDALAEAFASRFAADPERGYGAVSYWILSRVSAGADWRKTAAEPYRGQGSLGNGGAMRAGPLGAYFADDLSRVASEATLSAAVTHAHAEGQAGAVAVAVATAVASRGPHAGLSAMLDVAGALPVGEVRARVLRAADLRDASPREAGAILGTGLQVTAHDTVPFALWCAFRNLSDYRSAQLAAMAGFESNASDRDTICAIVGSVVSMSCDPSTIPADWVAQREPLPADVDDGSIG
jgi:ADP-ribosylglycohydrolase